MSVDALDLLDAHDPARRLAPLEITLRDELRRAIVATPVAVTGAPHHPTLLRRRRTLVLAVATVTMLGAVAGGLAASGIFKSPAQEEQGLPGGSTMFIGTHPTCSPTSDDSFRCVLRSTPTVETIQGSYLGTKMQSVDNTKHVDGGCVAISDDGLTWDCYLGQAAVDHGIIGAGLLGIYQPTPASG